MHKPTDPLPAEVVFALKRSNSVEAVKLLHKATGLSIEEAKAVIDEHLRRTGKPTGRIASMLGLPFALSSALRQGNRIEAIRLLREKAGLGLKEAEAAVESLEKESIAEKRDRSSGEVRGPSSNVWFVAVLAAIAYLCYHFFWRSS